MRIAYTSMLCLTLIGCASQPEKIQASYVSPIGYKDRTCDELKAEILTLNTKVQEVSAEQKRSATNDAVAMGVGAVLFAPALLVMAATPDKADELAGLKGEFEAAQTAYYQNDCPAFVLPAPEKKPAKQWDS